MLDIVRELVRQDVVRNNNGAGTKVQHIKEPNVILFLAVDQGKFHIIQLRQRLRSISKAKINKIAETQLGNRLFGTRPGAWVQSQARSACLASAARLRPARW